VNTRARDEGSMLVEMLVGMVLMSIVGMLVLQGIVDGFRSQRILQNRSEALAEVRTASERLARDIRGANPVLSATGTTLQIRRYAPNGDSVRMVWEITTTGGVTSLKKSVYTTPVGSTTEGPAVTTTALDKLTASVEPFTYYPVANFTVPSGSTVSATTCAITGTSPVQYAPTCIGEVFLHLSRTVSGHTPVAVDAEIDLRNQT
jgi:type II secretory pathway pseudopilin PulG